MARIVGIAAWALSLLLVLTEPASPQSPRRRAKSSSDAATSPVPVSTSAPLTLKQLTQLATEKRLTVERFAILISERKLAFIVTDEIVESLAQQGAPAEKLEVLKKMRPPPPEPPATGSLLVTCSPPECEIAINSRLYGATAGGKKIITGLALGRALIDLSKTDPSYFGKQIEATVEPNKIIEVPKVELKPTDVTRAQFGKELFEQTIRALGGRDALKGANAFVAEGECNAFDAQGARTSYHVRVRGLLPGLLSIDATDATGKKSSLILDSTGAAGGNRTKGAMPFILVKLATLLRDMQPVRVIENIDSRHMQLMADKPPSLKEPGRFAASSPVSLYYIEIEPQTSFPVVVRHEVPGIGDAEQANWYDFVALGTSKFPRHVVLRYMQQHSKEGVEFVFRSVDPAPNLKRQDFK